MIRFGFFFTGLLLALPGCLLPAWHYNLEEQHARAGWLFFAVSAGLGLPAALGAAYLNKYEAKPLFESGCLLAVPALLLLYAATPFRFESQLLGLFLLGAAISVTQLSSLSQLRTAYQADRRGAITRAGIAFGAGCLSAAVLAAVETRWLYFPRLLPSLAVFLAVIGLPVLRKAAPGIKERRPPDARALSGFSRPGALLLAALLLFQSGSEWTVAGWLPLFLTHRLGLSPETSLWMLVLFWLALLLGRAANGILLSRVGHGRILFVSAGAALFGCVLLISTDNLLGAFASILLLGTGFAAIYPLLAEKLGSRFSQYSPDLFHGILSFTLAGGMLFAFAAGLLAQVFGLTVIVLIPAMSIFLVVALLLVLWLESKVTGRS